MFKETLVASASANAERLMLYITPVIFAYISATVPAGLALYWVTTNVVSILQQLYINRRLANQSK